MLPVRIEAVVTDLDGTVVRSDFSISPATLDALDLVRSAGIAFVIATARTPQGLEHFQELAMRTSIAVCCSGAIGWRSPEKAMAWMEELPADRDPTRRRYLRRRGCRRRELRRHVMANDRGVLAPEPNAAARTDSRRGGQPRARRDAVLHDGGAAPQRRPASHRRTRCGRSGFCRTQSRRTVDRSRCHRARRGQGHRNLPRIAHIGAQHWRSDQLRGHAQRSGHVPCDRAELLGRPER